MRPNAGCQRTFRDPTPTPSFRKTRSRRREPRPEGEEPKVKFNYVEVPEGRGQRKMQIAPMVKLGGTIEPPIDLKTIRCGGFLGLIAIGLVLNMWMGVLLGIVYQLIGWDPSCWGEWTYRSFIIALYGVHLFGIAGHSLSRGYRSWGVIAIVSFWVSFLGWIPIGLLISWLS